MLVHDSRSAFRPPREQDRNSSGYHSLLSRTSSCALTESGLTSRALVWVYPQKDSLGLLLFAVLFLDLAAILRLRRHTVELFLYADDVAVLICIRIGP